MAAHLAAGDPVRHIRALLARRRAADWSTSHAWNPFALSVGPVFDRRWGRSRRATGVSTSLAARATLNANGRTSTNSNG